MDTRENSRPTGVLFYSDLLWRRRTKSRASYCRIAAAQSRSLDRQRLASVAVSSLSGPNHRDTQWPRACRIGAVLHESRIFRLPNSVTNHLLYRARKLSTFERSMRIKFGRQRNALAQVLAPDAKNHNTNARTMMEAQNRAHTLDTLDRGRKRRPASERAAGSAKRAASRVATSARELAFDAAQRRLGVSAGRSCASSQLALQA